MTSPATAYSRNTDIALLVLRLVAGVAFAFHGWQKVAQMGIGQITDFFGKAGVPLPGITAPVVSYLELIGGVLLIVGFLARYVPWLLMIDMLGAIIFVHAKNGYSMEHMGAEYPLALGGMALALALMGAGGMSVDAVMRKKS